ncbi:MAG: hypothetical protein PVJ57_09810 [Phycisphaerae bacterium]
MKKVPDRLRRIVIPTGFVLCALGVLCALCVLAFWALRSDWTPPRIEESKRIGDRILEACAAYHEDHGRYPASLDKLVPEYLDRIEPPVAGSKTWRYGGNDEACTLTFGQGEHCYPCCFRSWPKDSQWHMDT